MNNQDQPTNLDRSVNCPNCGHIIDVQDMLYHKVDEALQLKYDEKIQENSVKVQNELKAIQQEKDDLKNKLESHEESVKSEVRRTLNQKEEELRIKIKSELSEEQAVIIQSLQNEVVEKSSKLKDLNKTKIELEKTKREKEELKESIMVDAEREMTRRIATEKEKIQQAEADKSRLQLSEREQVIEQLNAQLKDAQRKAEQGSMQLQGEVQELAIEDWLNSQFPLDSIEEIKKGARGADCLQTVNTRSRQNCGSIYYESKRTKEFSPAWIAKFKQDIQDKNADIGVLVTEAMPADMESMGLRDGVWICSFSEFKGLCLVLRESIIKISTAIVVQENKGDKMGMIYDYLTGNEFKMQIEAIVEGFTQLQTDLESEKRAMQGIWKKREKQIQKVLLNTNHMYSSVKGIAGNAVKSVSLLELSDQDDLIE